MKQFYQESETNDPLEVESFKPHFGNNLMFRFRNGQPEFTVGPHWPFSICLAFLIIFATYFIGYSLLSFRGIKYQLISIASGLLLLITFILVFLKNPGINFTYVNVQETDGSCKACKLIKAPGTVHCIDCDICVRGHDHHCPWVGKCIGEGNMLQFQAFIGAFILFFTVSVLLIMI